MIKNKIMDVVLILGFLVVDWLLFHDLFKAGESYTPVEFLTGILSLLVIVRAVMSLLSRHENLS